MVIGSLINIEKCLIEPIKFARHNDANSETCWILEVLNLHKKFYVS